MVCPWGITYGSILGCMNIHFATYFDVHQGYRVLTHSHLSMASPLCVNSLGRKGGEIKPRSEIHRALSARPGLHSCIHSPQLPREKVPSATSCTCKHGDLPAVTSIMELQHRKLVHPLGTGSLRSPRLGIQAKPTDHPPPSRNQRLPLETSASLQKPTTNPF